MNEEGARKNRGTKNSRPDEKDLTFERRLRLVGRAPDF